MRMAERLRWHTSNGIALATHNSAPSFVSSDLVTSRSVQLAASSIGVRTCSPSSAYIDHASRLAVRIVKHRQREDSITSHCRFLIARLPPSTALRQRHPLPLEALVQTQSSASPPTPLLAVLSKLSRLFTRRAAASKVNQAERAWRSLEASSLFGPLPFALSNPCSA